MKKLILLAIIALGMNSCSYTSFKHRIWKVVDVDKEVSHCVYELETMGFNTYFIDDCNKYDIGDTIKLFK